MLIEILSGSVISLWFSSAFLFRYWDYVKVIKYAVDRFYEKSVGDDPPPLANIVLSLFLIVYLECVLFYLSLYFLLYFSLVMILKIITPKFVHIITSFITSLWTLILGRPKRWFDQIMDEIKLLEYTEAEEDQR